MGPEHKIVVSRRLRVRVPSEVFFFSFFFFSFTLVLKMLHMVFFLEVVLLKKLQFNKKKIKKMSKKGWDNHLGSTSSFFIVFHCWS